MTVGMRASRADGHKLRDALARLAPLFLFDGPADRRFPLGILVAKLRLFLSYLLSLRASHDGQQARESRN